MTAQGSHDIVIIDETESCPYLPDQTARMPLRMPLVKIGPREADQRLAEGNRRTGEFVYQTRCPHCDACEAIRLDCQQFEFSASQRRVLNRGRRRLEQRIGPIVADPQRVDLFNKHRIRRGLVEANRVIDLEEYIWGFVRSCFESFEISYWLNDQLAAVSICDRGETSLSAVYTYFDPEIRGLSLGTYSILRQIQYCNAHQMRYLYLGYYVAQSPHMKYKARFRPHERLIAGQWVRFEA